MVHAIGWVGDRDDFSTREVGRVLLTRGRHHSHTPALLRQRWDRDQVALFEESDGFVRQRTYQLRLTTWFHVQAAYMLLRGEEVIAEAELPGCLPAPSVTPLEFALGDGDEFLGRVRNTLEGEFGKECLAADRVTHQGVIVLWVQAADVSLEMLTVFPECCLEFFPGRLAPP